LKTPKIFEGKDFAYKKTALGILEKRHRAGWLDY
jgi:hypothetical protein